MKKPEIILLSDLERLSLDGWSQEISHNARLIRMLWRLIGISKPLRYSNAADYVLELKTKTTA